MGGPKGVYKTSPRSAEEEAEVEQHDGDDQGCDPDANLCAGADVGVVDLDRVWRYFVSFIHLWYSCQVPPLGCWAMTLWAR